MKAVMRYLLSIVFAIIAATAFAGPKTSDVVMLDIIGSESAFAIQNKTGEVWWIREDCKVSIPTEELIEPQAGINQTAQSIFSTKKLVQTPRIGNHQVLLEQAFKFNLTSNPPQAEVFNSVRGGWAEIEVSLNQTCPIDAQCQLRMEYPDC